MAEARRPKVLVVDEEPDVALSLKRLLERRIGASVEVAGGADAARGRLPGDFEVVTLDYQMPDGDGLTLLQEIVALPDAPRAVMVTGHGDEQSAVDAFRYGASGYVAKDQRLPELLTDAVSKALLETRLKDTERALHVSEEELILGEQ